MSCWWEEQPAPARVLSPKDAPKAPLQGTALHPRQSAAVEDASASARPQDGHLSLRGFSLPLLSPVQQCQLTQAFSW